MVDLQKFKDFLARAEELDKDITALEARRTEAERMCVTLTARQQFLQGSLDSLKEAVTELEDQRNETVAQYKAEESLLNRQKETLKTEMTGLEATIKKMEDGKAKLEAEHLAATTIRNKELEELKAEATTLSNKKHDLDAETEQAESKLQQLRGDVADAEGTLAAYKAKENDAAELFALEQASAQKALDKLAKETKAARLELEGVINTLDDSRIAIAEAEKKHAAFEEYEKRANKALESRERAIIERENELAIEAKLAQRRSSTLGQITL